MKDKTAPVSAVSKSPIPPYVSYRTFLNILENLSKDGIPPQIDRTTFSGMSGGTYNQLITALRYLRLTDSTDHPLELESLVKASGSERQKILGNLVKKAYPYLFEGFDLNTATPKALEDKFKATGADGETVRKCISFFINIARDGGIALGSRLTGASRGGKSGIARTRSTTKKKRTHKHQEEAENGNGEVNKGGEIEPQPMSSVVKAAMDKIPTFDPTWPQETQNNYMKYVERVFDLVSGEKKTETK